MTVETDIRKAPMPAAPMRYLPDGSVDWGNMWDSFCVLARDGGPPHRETPLGAGSEHDTASLAYQQVVQEIIRGIAAVSGLSATPAEPGWIAVQCHTPEMARWLSESIVEENVAARYDGDRLFVPTAAHYTLKGEIKNVITAVAKTTHYWWEHLPPDVRRAMLVERQIKQFSTRLRGWLRGERNL